MSEYTTWYSGSEAFEATFPDDLSAARVNTPQVFLGVNDGSSFFVDETGLAQYTGAAETVFSVKYTFTIEPSSKTTGLRLWISKNGNTVFNDEGLSSICFDNTAFVSSPSIGQLSFSISDTVTLHPFETLQLMGAAQRKDGYDQIWSLSDVCCQIQSVS